MNWTLINKRANKIIKEWMIDKDIRYCEARIKGVCQVSSGLTFAHKHKRNWYKGRLELLHDYDQVILACLPCHQILEYNLGLTEIIFDRCRPQKEEAKEELHEL